MFYFFLGNTPDLSLLELRKVYLGEFTFVTKDIASYDAELDLNSLPHLGGTMKVAQSLEVVSPKKVISTLVELISADSQKNIALTDYASLDLGRAVFHELKDKVERSIRFVSMETGPHELVMLSHQHVLELNLIPSGSLLEGKSQNIIIAKTVWIYDAEDWVSRDRSKPYRDIKRGMLPPKLARIITNLATGGKSGLTLADPFCGTGTVLMEAMMVGCNVLGGDTNPEAITGAKSNLEWILSTPGLAPRTYALKLGDATHFDEFFPSCDCIATEPYMGPLLDERNPSSLDKIKNIAKGLDKLYRGAFKSFYKSLPVGGRVVMTIPSFRVYGKEISTISIDTLVTLGYNYISSVPYSKPGAAVIRNITILEKK
jgi:tRNA G10  N-methylase Trm11